MGINKAAFSSGLEMYSGNIKILKPSQAVRMWALVTSGTNKHCTKPPAAVVLTGITSVDRIIPQHKQRCLSRKAAGTIPVEVLFAVRKNIISSLSIRLDIIPQFTPTAISGQGYIALAAAILLFLPRYWRCCRMYLQFWS